MCCGKIANPLTLMNCNWKSEGERGSTMNTFWVRMKGKDGEKKKGSPVGQIRPAIDSNTKTKKKRNKRDKENKKIWRRWEKDGINRGQNGLISGNKPILLAIHTYGKPGDWRPCAFPSFTHRTHSKMYTHAHTHTPDGAFMQSARKPPGFMRSEGQVPSGGG